MMPTTSARRLIRYAAAWTALAGWAVLCARLGVPGASGWILPCAVAGGTLACLAAVVGHRGRR